MARRFLRVALVWFLLGAVFNLLLAWALVWWNPHMTPVQNPVFLHTDQSPFYWSIRQDNRFGTILIHASSPRTLDSAQSVNTYDSAPGWSLLHQVPTVRMISYPGV
ncbi:MAG: hypothetical protein O7G85_07060 [Planctomycetota bacterium]|nr:hypothetical protein [Planctomycetota bacterium]